MVVHPPSPARPVPGRPSRPRPALAASLLLALVTALVTTVGCSSRYSLEPESDDSGTPADADTQDAVSRDGAVPRCGDRRRDPGETCDGSDLGGLDCAALGFFEGALRCLSDCTLDTSWCVPRCGNGKVDPGEECDGQETGDVTCEELGLQAGAVTCRSDCTFDVTHCPGCGNNVQELGEACDGTDLGGLGCAGTPLCSAECLLDLTGCALPGAGTGADGSLEVSGDVVLGAPLAGAYPVLSLGTDSVVVDDPSPALAPGDEVILVNLRGSPGLCDTAGTFETGHVASVQGSEITLGQPIAGVYGTSGANDNLSGQRVVVQRVPQLADLHVLAGGLLHPAPFDGTRGGILALRVAGTLRVEAGGALAADGAGYRGGAGWPNNGRQHGRPGESLCGWPQDPSYAPNFGGGGGGRYQDTSDDCGQGGGGGGYGTEGEWRPFYTECVNHGATSPAQNGGLVNGAADLSLLLPGSGGGAGATDDHSNTSGTGGAGGGILWVVAARVELEGLLTARGAGGTVPSDTTDSGNGGGGSGGAIWLAAGALSGAGGLDARGGPGAAATNTWNNPGAPGGVGRIRLDIRTADGHLFGSSGAASWTATHALPPAGHQQLLIE